MIERLSDVRPVRGHSLARRQTALLEIEALPTPSTTPSTTFR